MTRVLAATLALLLAVPTLRAAEQAFTEDLWRAAEPIYLETLKHPFLKGLMAGDLPKAKFDYYLVQDAKYLRVFGQALSILAAKAPREGWSATLNQHAIDTLQAERQLHESILASRGINTRQAAMAEMSPTNVAYTNHLIATVSQRPFVEGLAAVLPCYWVYQRVGEHLSEKGSPDKDYQQWIATYAGDDYGASVSAVLAMMDGAAAEESAEVQRQAKLLYVRSTRYEYLFWDMAWREERWRP